MKTCAELYEEIQMGEELDVKFERAHACLLNHRKEDFTSVFAGVGMRGMLLQHDVQPLACGCCAETVVVQADPFETIHELLTLLGRNTHVCLTPQRHERATA